MPYFVGIDIGSRAAKGCITDNGQVMGTFIGDTLPESAASGQMVFDEMAKPLGIAFTDCAFVVATGYGRVSVPFANVNISEISCHARGAHHCLPSVRTILDMGGQDCKAVNVDDNGLVTNFVMNDKCAGGTGRFMEVIATVLGVPLEEIGPLSLQSTEKIAFSTVCAVFAKSTAMSMLKRGISKADILAGLFQAISERTHNLLSRVTIEKDFVITGGIAKNTGMVAKITEVVGLEPMPLDFDPQLAGALGASLFAQDRWKAKQAKEAAKAG